MVRSGRGAARPVERVRRASGGPLRRRIVRASIGAGHCRRYRTQWGRRRGHGGTRAERAGNIAPAPAIWPRENTEVAPAPKFVLDGGPTTSISSRACTSARGHTARPRRPQPASFEEQDCSHGPIRHPSRVSLALAACGCDAAASAAPTYHLVDLSHGYHASALNERDGRPRRARQRSSPRSECSRTRIHSRGGT